MQHARVANSISQRNLQKIAIHENVDPRKFSTIRKYIKKNKTVTNEETFIMFLIRRQNSYMYYNYANFVGTSIDNDIHTVHQVGSSSISIQNLHYTMKILYTIDMHTVHQDGSSSISIQNLHYTMKIFYSI